MPNGNLIYGGRAVGSIFAGRALSALSMANGGPNGRTSPPAWPGSGYDWPAFPRSPGMCTPPLQCCCKGPWTIGPGETLPLLMDWSRWLQSVQGFQLGEVTKATLLDVTKSPMVPADPDVIKVLSGKAGDPDPPNNGDVASLIRLLPPFGIQVFISAAPDAAIGAQFKLDLCVSACSGCEGKMVMCDCVVITIQEC